MRHRLDATKLAIENDLVVTLSRRITRRQGRARGNEGSTLQAGVASPPLPLFCRAAFCAGLDVHGVRLFDIVNVRARCRRAREAL
jgi:hypothetical protein